jgi:phosphoenolpyruvate carboxykinase (ATP)
MDKTKEILSAVKKLKDLSNTQELSFQEIRSRAEMFGTETIWGNYNFVSTVKNRSAKLTVYVGSDEVMKRNWSDRQKEIIKDVPNTFRLVKAYMKQAHFIHVKRNMGKNNIFSPRCHLFVSVQRKEMIRLAYMWGQTLFSADNSSGPDQYLVYIPEWQEKDRQILVFPEINTTFVLGADYYGEAKKGHLRMAMWNAKKQGMLGLHAGSKIIYAREAKTDKIKKYGVLIFGLTATGKTTHSCHDHGLNLAGEGIEILQDDIVFLRKDGASLGTEKGFYLKTEGVNPHTQPVLYKAATSRDCIFENVFVNYRGEVDFDNETLTSNGRGVMQRDDFGELKGEDINLPPIDNLDRLIILFITRRNTIVPILSKINLEQAACAFMLGESIESSGSDPKRAGESVREVGTNPFIIGDSAEEGNRFYDIISQYPDKIGCYLVNTGGVGELVENSDEDIRIIKQKVLRPEIPETAANIRNIVRGTIEWEKEPYFGTLLPKRVAEGIDINKFDLKNFYGPTEMELLINQLQEERRKYLDQFPNLYPQITGAFE